MCVRFQFSQYRSKWWLNQAFLGLSLLLCMGWAQAHEVRPAVVTVDVQDDGVFTVGIDLNLEALLSGLTAVQGEQHSDKEADGETDARVLEYERLRALSAAELKATFVEQKTAFLASISVKTQEVCLPLTVASVSIPEVSVLPVARNSLIVLKGQLSDEQAAAWTWRWSARFGAAILRVNAAEKEVYTDYLEAGVKSPVITLP